MSFSLDGDLNPSKIMSLLYIHCWLWGGQFWRDLQIVCGRAVGYAYDSVDAFTRKDDAYANINSQ